MRSRNPSLTHFYSPAGNEVELLRTLDHPNVIKLIEYFETSDGKIFLILEALSGGELYDRLNMQPEGRFREADAVNLMVQMANAVAYMHSEGIVHRDLKLENFLFRDKTGMDLKIIDLGLSHRCEQANRLFLASCWPHHPNALPLLGPLSHPWQTPMGYISNQSLARLTISPLRFLRWRKKAILRATLKK